MDWYIYVCWILIPTQLFVLFLAFNNYRYALDKFRKKRSFMPRAALIIPCKDLDANFEQNISSFYRQDYEDYILLFVVGSIGDAAYRVLCELKEKFKGNTNAKDVSIFVAGPLQTSSQKIHNLLYAYRQVPDDIEVLAFADSDICVRPVWLRNLVSPLRHKNRGAATGYRWFVPRRNNFATLAMSAMNAKVTQLLGNTFYNQVWGGSMAIKAQTFSRLGMDKIWEKAVSDDLSLSYAVKKARQKVEFVPGCIVASYEQTTWPKLFEFARRQFLITRVMTPGTWWLGFVSVLYSVFGLWGGTALAAYAALKHNPHVWLFASVPILFFIALLTRAILRQVMAAKLLKEDWPKMRVAAVIDIALSWLWSTLMLVLILSSAFGRTIRWRGIRYKLLGPGETIVLGS
jgi:cellulose synthase/poly-beta-1,6-N-acetylglucosamine synthase-like glycosyltransferase